MLSVTACLYLRSIFVLWFGLPRFTIYDFQPQLSSGIVCFTYPTFFQSSCYLIVKSHDDRRPQQMIFTISGTCTRDLLHEFFIFSKLLYLIDLPILIHSTISNLQFEISASRSFIQPTHAVLCFLIVAERCRAMAMSLRISPSPMASGVWTRGQKDTYSGSIELLLFFKICIVH